MFHSGTTWLIDLWASLPDSRGIPARADLRPEAVGGGLIRLFLADRRGDDAVIRLAGGPVETLHDMPLAGRSWLSLWRRESRPLVASAVIQTFREGRPVVVVADAGGAPMEIALAPLRGAAGEVDLLLGHYQPTLPARTPAEAPAWPASGPLEARLSVGVGDLRRPRLTLAARDGRRIA